MAADPRQAMWKQYFNNALSSNNNNADVYAGFDPSSVRQVDVSPSAPQPTSGGLGDTLAIKGKNFGLGFLDGLRNIIKGVETPLAYSGTLGNDLKNGTETAFTDAFTKNPALNKVMAGHIPSLDDILSGAKNGISDFNANFNGSNSPYAAAANVWNSPDGLNITANSVNDSSGYNTLMGKLGVPIVPPHDGGQPWYDNGASWSWNLSPGNIVDGLAQQAMMSGVGKGVSRAIDALPKSKSVYRQAVEEAANPTTQATVPQDAGMDANVGSIPSILNDWAMPQGAAEKAALNSKVPTDLPATLGEEPNMGQQAMEQANNYMQNQQPLPSFDRQMTPTNIKFPQFKPQPLVTPTMKNAAQELDQLFNTAQGNGLPAGREFEYLQGLYPSIVGEQGGSFDNLLNQLNPPDIMGAPRVNAAGVTSKDMIQNMLQMGQKPLDETATALGAENIGKTPSFLNDDPMALGAKVGETPAALKASDSLPTALKLGDSVTPVSESGELLTANPAKITDIQISNGKRYFQVEGSKTYFPENQILEAKQGSAVGLGDLLSSLNSDISSTDKASLLNTLGKGTGLHPNDLENIANLNKFNPTKGTFDIPDILKDLEGINPKESPTMSDSTPSSEEYQGLGDNFKSPLLDEIMQNGQQLRQNALTKRISDVMAKLGIFGSGVNTLKDNEMNAIKNGVANTNNQVENVSKWGEDLAKQTGEEGKADLIKHMYDYEAGNGQGNNEVFQKLIHALQHGAPNTESGLIVEKSKNVAPDTLRDNYFPIGIDTKNTPKDLLDALESDYQNNLKLKKRSLDQTYTIDRKFPSNYQAEQAGYAIHDPITSATQRLQASAHDIGMNKMFQELKDAGMANGRISDTPGKDLIRYTSKDDTNPLNGSFVHKDIAHTMDTMFNRTPWANANIPVFSKGLQGWDKMIQTLRNLTLYSALPHDHNVFGNALMAAGISPDKYLEAENGIKGLETFRNQLSKNPGDYEKAWEASGEKLSPEMKKSLEWAEKTGALGEHYGDDTATKIQRAYGNKGSLLDQAKDAYNNKYQDPLLWNRERALRGAVFNDFFNGAKAQGLADADAANVAREATLKHMIDYSNNNLSTFEREIMSRIDPFYRWHKGNYPLQLGKMTDPEFAIGKVGGFYGQMDRMQREMTGHGLDGNHDGNRLKLEIPMDDKGNYMPLSPYMPFQEAFNLTSQNPLNTLFNRFAKPASETMNQLTNNKYYPSQMVTPLGRDYMTGKGYEIRNPTTSAWDQTKATVGHAATHTILPDDAPLTTLPASIYQALSSDNQQDKYPSTPAIYQLLSALSGSFMGSTPVSDSKVNAQNAKEQKWLNAYKKAAQRGK